MRLVPIAAALLFVPAAGAAQHYAAAMIVGVLGGRIPGCGGLGICEGAI